MTLRQYLVQDRYQTSDGGRFPFAASKPAFASLLITLGCICFDAVAEVPTVTVEAQRDAKQLRQDVSAFVNSALVKPFDDSLMRWDHPMCPMVAGMARPEGEFVLHRLSDIARAAVAPLGKEDCKPNFFVIVARNPSAFIKLAWRRRPGLFNTAHGIVPVKRFIETDRPIRVWYNSADIGAGSGEAFSSALAESAGLSLGTVDYPVRVAPSTMGSHITRFVVQNIESVLIVVNPQEIQKLNMGQLVDYVALVGLAQINLDTSLGQAPSILKIFDEESPPQSMTPWDMSLLRALYTTPQREKLQMSKIQTRMFVELSKQAAK